MADEVAADERIELRVSLEPHPGLSPADRDWWHERFAQRGLQVRGGSMGPSEWQVWFEVVSDDFENFARSVLAVVRDAAPDYEAELIARAERHAAYLDAKRRQVADYQAILDRLMRE